MARRKRGKELAKEMVEAPRTRPAAQECPVCEEWTSYAHEHARKTPDQADDKPQDGGQ